ncbi:MAG: DUF6364 family protein [Chloroflexi bacterium]|nr:DUF6364 family protein [Chloroflexota bacterium]
MNYQNITLSIPKEVLKQARIIAIQRRQSLSGIVTEFITEIVESDMTYQQAYQRQTKQLDKGFELKFESGSRSNREALHER